MINVILFQPEKPMNTGNIMRTCRATNSILHIIGPLTYNIDDKGLHRAGMDYLKDFKYNYYNSYEEFLDKNKNPKIHYITRYGFNPPSDVDFTDTSEDVFIMFGKESTGIPKHILKEHLDRCYRLPMVKDARSLNLSNCVAIVVYEVLRQQNYASLSRTESIKGADFLLSVNND